MDNTRQVGEVSCSGQKAAIPERLEGLIQLEKKKKIITFFSPSKMFLIRFSELEVE